MAAPQLERRLGAFNATTINMSNMVGIGPFITIPIILGTLGGPQSYLAWLLGVAIALADGLVVAELGAALPASGGTYVFLREGFPGKLGRLFAFLFIWQILFAGPLEAASGTIGLVEYLRVFITLDPLQAKLAAAGVAAIVILALYRNIGDIAKLMAALWAVMIATTGWVILTALFHFDPALAFDLPADAWNFDFNFLQGLGEGGANILYLFLGYYQVCYLGGEVREPGRTIPKAVVWSILGVTVIDGILSFGFIGVVPWREIIAPDARPVGALFMEAVYGPWAAQVLAGLIVVTAFASVFALLLGYSRVPYAAAKDGFFFPFFGQLHPTAHFPHRSLLMLGGATIVASFFSLEDVISGLMAARILIQFIGHTIALILIRKNRPDIERPFQMPLFPLPAVISLVGYTYIFLSLGWKFIAFGVGTLIVGALVYTLTVGRTEHKTT